jgi:4-hydroxy-tetrahydrodipicolinate reductase
MTTRLAVCGAAGRMGKAIIAACNETDAVQVTAAIEHGNYPRLGHDSGEIAGLEKNNVTIIADISLALENFDVAIDFTLPQATVGNIGHCKKAGKPMVIGTTGFNPGQQAVIQAASREIGIVFAANMSVGVNLCFKLTELAAEIMGDSADIEILEAHHRMKKDAPSGTAVRMGEIIANKLGRDLEECAVYGRHGITGEREPGTIGFESIRAGDIVGEHTVMFATNGERIEITHKASSRKTFASGALLAAHWIMGKGKGLYDMQDVLGLR